MPCAADREARPRSLRRFGAVLALAALLLAAAPVAADEYEPTDAGHPLRILAYVLHPVGVVLDVLLFRPAHWLASHEPVQTLVGHED